MNHLFWALSLFCIVAISSGRDAEAKGNRKLAQNQTQECGKLKLDNEGSYSLQTITCAGGHRYWGNQAPLAKVASTIAAALAPHVNGFICLNVSMEPIGEANEFVPSAPPTAWDPGC